MTGFAIELERVVKRYQLGEGGTLVALNGVNAVIPAGALCAITGPSGSGKSTLLHLIGAMDRPDAGSICVGGIDITRLSRGDQAAYRRTIGFVFQRFHLLPALTVRDNVIAPVIPFRTQFDKFERAHELLAAVGLAHREGSVPSRLSGGEQQRVAIARALVNNPGLLLADEPTGNLDSATSSEIMELLLALRAERGVTVLIATHDPMIASRCERILAVKDGRIIDDITVPGTDQDGLFEQITRPDPHR